MTDESVIAGLIKERWTPTLHVCGEWISNGTWACKSTARPANMTIQEQSAVLSGLLDRLSGSVDFAYGPLEVTSARATVLDERPDCDLCHGSGYCICATCEHEHNCGRCDGSGKIGEDVSVTGWARMGRDDVGEVVISDLALPLLEGLEIRRAVVTEAAMTWTTGRWAIVGLRDGMIEAVVMPRATAPEKCK